MDGDLCPIGVGVPGLLQDLLWLDLSDQYRTKADYLDKGYPTHQKFQDTQFSEKNLGKNFYAPPLPWSSWLYHQDRKETPCAAYFGGSGFHADPFLS